MTLIAVAADGYVFSHWVKNGTVLSTAESHTFTVTTPQTYVAYFVPVMHDLHISVSADPPAAGIVKGGGDVVQGDEVEVEAEVRDGWIFTIGLKPLPV